MTTTNKPRVTVTKEQRGDHSWVVSVRHPTDRDSRRVIYCTHTELAAQQVALAVGYTIDALAEWGV